METTFTEQGVQIAGVRFQHNAEQIRFESFPRRLIYRGREYILAES